MQVTNDPNAPRIDPAMAADLQGFRELLLRMSREGMFRRDLRADCNAARGAVGSKAKSSRKLATLSAPWWNGDSM